jgi:hypothetical protein
VKRLPENALQVVFLTLTLAVLVAGWFFWSRDLTADAPLNFSGFSQALSTDPALYTYHAKNRVLFDKADPVGDARWILFEKSFAGLLATTWFEMSGISIPHGRQVGMALTFAGFLLLLAGLWRHHRPWVTAAVATTLATNIVLIVYGTYPFLEISLLFFAGLTFFIYSCWGDRWWGLALSGVAIAAATFAGKIFGILLLPVLVGCELLTAPGGSRMKRSGVAIGSFIVAAGILVTLLYGSHLIDAIGFLKEQSYESKGFPLGLSSPWEFIAHLLAYGFRNDLYFECPDLLLFFFASAVLLMIGLQNERDLLRRLPRTTLFALGWVLFTWIGLSPQNYSPARYSLTFIPAVTILCFTLIDTLHARKPTWRVAFGWWPAAGVGLAGWVMAVQLGLRWFEKPTPDFDLIPFMMSTLPVGIMCTLLARYLFDRLSLRITRTALTMIAIVGVAASVASNAYGYTWMDMGTRRYHVITANHDIEYLLGPGAVISGPYAAAFTQENKILSHPHFFGETWSDSSRLVDLPITHLAVDKSNFTKAVAQSKSLGSAEPITTYLIGAHEVSIFDISQIYDNPVANGYQKSRYEKAVRYFNTFKFDSAMMALAEDPELIDRSRSAALLYARSMFKADLDDEAVHNYQVLHNRYPTDFLISLEAANAIHQVAEVRGDSTLYVYSAGLYGQAIELNPWETRRVEKLANDTHDYFEKQRQARRSVPDSQK